MRVTYHLTDAEVACRCGCGRSAMHPAVLAMFEVLRWEVSRVLGRDTPLQVTSGARCLAWQRHVYEVRRMTPPLNSSHVMTPALALDILCPSQLTLDRFHDIANQVVGAGGLGIYPRQNFIHIDCRGISGIEKPDGQPFRRWRS